MVRKQCSAATLNSLLLLSLWTLVSKRTPDSLPCNAAKPEPQCVPHPPSAFFCISPLLHLHTSLHLFFFQGRIVASRNVYLRRLLHVYLYFDFLLKKHKDTTNNCTPIVEFVFKLLKHLQIARPFLLCTSKNIVKNFTYWFDSFTCHSRSVCSMSDFCL